MGGLKLRRMQQKYTNDNVLYFCSWSHHSEISNVLGWRKHMRIAGMYDRGEELRGARADKIDVNIKSMKDYNIVARAIEVFRWGA